MDHPPYAPPLSGMALGAPLDTVDWAATPLGPPESWDVPLRQAVDLCLHTAHPCTLLWGPEFVMVYNEAYVPLIGDKHPDALGLPAQDVFPEIWDEIGPLMQGVFDGGPGFYVADQLLRLVRHGFPEDCYFSYSYSPVHDAAGRVVGVIDIATETTGDVSARRRLERLAALHAALVGADTPAEVSDAMHAVCAGDPDLPQLALRIGSPATDDDLPAAALDRGVPGRVHVEQHETGPVAWMPLVAGPTRPVATATLVVRLNAGVPFDQDYEQFLRLLGGALSQALNRVGLLDLERKVAAAEHELALSLQRAMLSPAPEVPGVQIAVRYLPAGRHAQVGGDWHDAFVDLGGALTFSVGDMSGHDLDAISAMGQVRTLLRGLALTGDAPPAETLTRLNSAFDTLGPELFATAFLARPTQTASGVELAWSNAGHPPGLLVSADRTLRYLEERPGMLLGSGLSAIAPPRQTFVEHLAEGDLLVLYTDGLIERSGRHLDEGLAWLRDQAATGPVHDAEAMADRLIEDLPAHTVDDVAVMVLRVGA